MRRARARGLDSERTIERTGGTRTDASFEKHADEMQMMTWQNATRKRITWQQRRVAGRHLVHRIRGVTELDLGHHLVVHHHLEVDLALGLVHEVEGLHFVLRKRVGLGEVMAPLECSIVLLLWPQGVLQWVEYDQYPFFLWLREEFHHLHHKYHFAPLGSRYFRQTPRYTSPQ